MCKSLKVLIVLSLHSKTHNTFRSRAGIVGMSGGLGGIFLITLSSYLDYTLTSVICGSCTLISAFLALSLQLDGKEPVTTTT